MKFPFSKNRKVSCINKRFYISDSNCGEELLSFNQKFCFGPDHEEKNQIIENPTDNIICMNPDNGKTENWLSVSHCNACDELSFFESNYYPSYYDYLPDNAENEYMSAQKSTVSFKKLL